MPSHATTTDTLQCRGTSARLDAIVEILARGVVRVLYAEARAAEPGTEGDDVSSESRINQGPQRLDVSARQSVHVVSTGQEGPAVGGKE